MLILLTSKGQLLFPHFFFGGGDKNISSVENQEGTDPKLMIWEKIFSKLMIWERLFPSNIAYIASREELGYLKCNRT